MRKHYMDDSGDFQSRERNVGVGPQDKWIVAAGGQETPFTFNGERFTYMWNAKLKKHAYYNHNRDVLVTDFRTGELLP